MCPVLFPEDEKKKLNWPRIFRKSKGRGITLDEVKATRPTCGNRGSSYHQDVSGKVLTGKCRNRPGLTGFPKGNALGVKQSVSAANGRTFHILLRLSNLKSTWLYNVKSNVLNFFWNKKLSAVLLTVSEGGQFLWKKSCSAFLGVWHAHRKIHNISG